MSVRFSILSVIVAGSVVLGACSGDGTTLREPGTGGATPAPVVIEPGPGESGDLDMSFVLQSQEFEANGNIPPRFTRSDGDNVSPPLNWINQPTSAVELALVVTDPSSNGFVHWVIWGLETTSTGLAEGEVPIAATQALNGFGELGWVGPDIPEVDDPHVYLFRLFALGDAPLDVPAGIAGREAIPLLEAHAIAIAELVGFYP